MSCAYVLNTFNVYLFNLTGLSLFITAIVFSLVLRFVQFRSFGAFFKLLTTGIQDSKKHQSNSINPALALFTAMSTSMGMGTIVSPSIAIVVGGPGALFWFIAYALLGSIIKFVEVVCGIRFRTTTGDGKILGGPMQYLNHASPLLGTWYAYATVFLFSGWSGLQANVLAETLSNIGVPVYITGILLTIFVCIMLLGGAQRIGEFNSKLIPIMFTLYISASLYIIFSNIDATIQALSLIINNILAPAPAVGGFVGASTWVAFQSGIHRSALITESGIGTAAIPHSMANVEKPTDQAILAMTSVWADTLLCFISGLLVLISGVWKEGIICNTMVYKTFTLFMPHWGKFILIASIIMFVTGTIIGNSFNGRQSYAALTKYRHLYWYYAFVCITIFLGSITEVPVVWAITDSLLPFVALPHIAGLWYLFFTNRTSFTI